MIKQAFAGLSLAAVVACGITKDPVVVQDFNVVVGCVLANDSSWEAMLANCSQYATAELIAAVEYALSDSAFKSARPDDAAKLEAALPSLKVHYAAELKAQADADTEEASSVNYLSAAHEAIAKSFNPFRFNGYIPDDAHRQTQQKCSTLLFGANPTGPAQVSLAKWRGPFVNQGQSGGCTGAGTAQIVFTAMGAAGTPIPFFPSQRRIYGTARTLERANASIALTDSGAMPTDLLTVLRLYGVAPMDPQTSPDGRFSDIWSADDLVGLVNPPPPNVNTDMDLLDLEQSGLKLLTGQYRANTSLSLGPQIVASLANNAPTGIGIFVDSAFENWNPSSGPIQKINLADPKGGGHWLALDYAYTDPQLGIVIGGPNSWGQMLWPYAPQGGPPRSPYWVPGCYEMTATCLQTVCSDCLLFPTKVI